MSSSVPAICLTPRVHGVGGMVTFYHKLSAGLRARGIRVVDDPVGGRCDAVLVIGGTRHFIALRRARQRGLPVVQRLDGMNWIHRRRGWLGNLRHYLRAEYGNLILQLIRTRIASHLVYQSDFVRAWWQRAHGPSSASSSVIYNGVDLQIYSPHGPEAPPSDRLRILMVEGSLAGGYEGGLDTAAGLVEQLCADHRASPGVELAVAGRVPDEHRRRIQARLSALGPRVALTWLGLVEPAAIPALDRSAHLLYSADINAACPNSAIEALACGLPVLGFATGALPELITDGAGALADYGGDPWRLDTPNIAQLAVGASSILNDLPACRSAARRRAVQAFDLEQMVDAYLSVLLGGRV